jgi:ABC-2 type transport system permease protein
LALAWRLHRGPLLSWTIGFAIIGAVVGSAAKTTDRLAKDSPALVEYLKRFGGQSALSEAYLSGVMSLLAFAAAAYAIQATLRLRSEEVAQRVEPVLATAVSRLQWATSHLVFGALGPAIALTAGGIGCGWAYGASVGDVGGQLGRLLESALVQLPAVWVLAGLAAALVGAAPRLTPLAWAALVGFLLLGQLGTLVRLSQRVLDLSPFTHVPRVPGGSMSVQPLIWLVCVAAALTVAGLAGLRRRDIG